MTEVSKSNGKPEASTEISVVDKQAEDALVASMIVEPKCIEAVFDIVGPDCFFIDSNRRIARAIQMLVRKESQVNVVMLATMLKTTGYFEQIGGVAGISRLLDATPSVALEDVLSYAQVVRERWCMRAAKAEAQALVAKIETGSIVDIGEAFRISSEHVTQITTVEDDSIFGFWASEFGDIVEEPKRETWLLMDSLTQKPALPIGRAAMLSASGGTGKTTSLAQLAVSVALGLDWCGFTVNTMGCVVLACGESDGELMKRHLWRACNQLELDETQRLRAMSQIKALPLYGKEVNMLSGKFNERTDFLRQFNKHLTKLAIEEKCQWSLVILDPLSRFAGSDTESDNAAATKFAQAVETLCKLPGTPCVLCAHHSSKQSAKDGQNDSRGVSGLRDAFRSVSIMTRHMIEGLVAVHMQCNKSNEAPHYQDRWLVQGTGNIGGTLRLATDSESAMFTEASEAKGKKKGKTAGIKLERPNLHDCIIVKLKELGGVVQSRDWLFNNHLSGYRKADVWDAFALLFSQHEITLDTSGPSRGTVRLTALECQVPLKVENNDGRKAETDHASAE